METPFEICVPLGAQDRLALLLVSAGSALETAGEDVLAPSGLDNREYSILSILDTDNPGSQQEIARLLNKAPALVVASVDRLEDRGLVQRMRDPADRRRSRVTLTRDGSRALAAADRLARDAVADLLGGLDAAELDQLHALLTKGLRPRMDADAGAAAA